MSLDISRTLSPGRLTKGPVLTAPADFVQALNRRDPAHKHSKSFRLLSHGEATKGAASRPTYLGDIWKNLRD